MASNVPTECSVCSEVFTEEQHCPRILPCAHCLCSKCIDKLIQTNSKSCPFCRQNFKAKFSRDLLINWSLLELIKYVAKLERPIKPPREGKANQLAEMITKFKEENDGTSKENLTECQRAASRITKAIIRNAALRDGLSRTNRLLDDEVFTKLQEIKTINRRHMKHLEEESGRLKTQLKGISSREKQIKVVNAELKAASDFAATAPIVGKAEETNKQMKKYLKDLEDFLTKDEKTLLGIENAAKQTDNKIGLVQEVLSSSDDNDEEDLDLILGKAEMAIHGDDDDNDDDDDDDDDPHHVTVGALRRLSDPIRAQIQNGCIMAVQDIQGRRRRRYARLSVNRNNQLFLHHLKEEKDVLPLPPNVRLIKFDDVMSLVDINCRRTFLELGIKGRSLGRLLIRLSDDIDNKLALNYILLCTGEKGPSYANSNILQAGSQDDDTEYAILGDYDWNNGQGGKAVIEGIHWATESERKNYNKPHVKGSVTGLIWSEKFVSQFLIYTRDSPGDHLGGCIGMVEEGLNVLTAAISQHPNIWAVKLLDCGALLSR